MGLRAAHMLLWVLLLAGACFGVAEAHAAGMPCHEHPSEAQADHAQADHTQVAQVGADQVRAGRGWPDAGDRPAPPGRGVPVAACCGTVCCAVPSLLPGMVLRPARVAMAAPRPAPSDRLLSGLARRPALPPPRLG